MKAAPAIPCRAVGLACEFLENPLGLETRTPRLSWRLEDPRNGARQTAFRIAAASSAEKLAAGDHDLWDTGKVESSETLDIAWGSSQRGGGLQTAVSGRRTGVRLPPARSGRRTGVRLPPAKALRPRSSVFWRVMVWDKDGAASPWSETAHFEIGLFGRGCVTAEWIGAKKPRTKPGMPAPMFRKAFLLGAEPVRARLHVSAFGDLEMSVNGKPASGDLFVPGWTDYRKRVPLVTWDVTALLHEGENVLGAMLGDGWFAGTQVWPDHRNHYGPSTAFLAQLEVELADGSRATVVTDTSWRCTEDGPVRASDHYNGETYDARLEKRGWDEPGFDAKGWRRAAMIEDRPHPALCARISGPVRRQRTLPALKRTEPQPGRYVFDFGQNMVGRPRLALRGRPGGAITIRYAEMLNADGTLYTENYRSAKSTDVYICGEKGHLAQSPQSSQGIDKTYLPGIGENGNDFADLANLARGKSIYEPHFTFHGFRYVELSGDFAAPPECGDVQGIVIHSDMAQTGAFECSDPLANRLFSNLNWGQMGNYLEVPTDCPQRDERLGWTGDAQVFVRTAAFNRDIAAFMEKWMRDIADAQHADGAFTDIAPDIFPDANHGHCGYADAGVVVPWTIYMAYGDKDILREHFDAMARWVGWWAGVAGERLVVPYTGRGSWHYGDWLAVDCPVDEDGHPIREGAPTPSDLLATAYFARSAGLVADAARALGRKADARRFEALRRRVAAAFRREFVTPGGRIAGDTQTGYLVALGFGLVDDPKTVARMVDRLSFLVESRDCSLTTGFLGTPLVCPVLARFGRADLAYKILQRRKYPSWYFQILDGDATTMWERWNSYTSKGGFGDANMNSFNHYAYGAIGEWLYTTVGGIDAAEPGFRKIRFAPVPGGDITWAKTSLLTRHGTAAIHWRRRRDGALAVELTVPPNTTATLELPGQSPRELQAGRHSFGFREASFAAKSR